MTTKPSIDQQRQELYELAEAIAPTWERRREFVESVSAPVRRWLLEHLAAQPGETILEVAAGAGDTGFEAAAAVGEEGRLISSDFSPTMVESARRRGRELGLTNVEYRVADAADTGLDDDSIDGVVCRWGYMLVADPAAALAEARRVLRPDGRLVLAVWGPPDRNPFFTSLAMILVERGAVPPPDPASPGIFTLSDEGRLVRLLEGAGFPEVRTEHVPVTFRVADPEEYVAIAADTAGGIGLALQRLGDAGRKEVAEQLGQAISGFSTGDGYELPGVGLCALARLASPSV